MSNYQKLDAWKQAMELVKEIYVAVKDFPRGVIWFDLTGQKSRYIYSIEYSRGNGETI